jgi:hypothetical protein
MAKNCVDEHIFSNKASRFLTSDVVQLAIISSYRPVYRVFQNESAVLRYSVLKAKLNRYDQNTYIRS